MEQNDKCAEFTLRTGRDLGRTDRMISVLILHFVQGEIWDRRTDELFQDFISRNVKNSRL